MLSLFTFWYVKSPGFAYGLYLSTVQELEVKIGVKDMLHNLRKPLFQDYTLQGRAIGLGLRLARILVGVLLYTFVAILYAFVYLFWLFFPLLCISSILGAFFGLPSI